MGGECMSDLGVITMRYTDEIISVDDVCLATRGRLLQPSLFVDWNHHSIIFPRLL